MKILHKVIIIMFFSLIFTTAHTADVIDKSTETIDKIKIEGKSILKTLTRTSLKEKEIKLFLSEHVITFDDERGDGLVTYYFNDKFYKRYKDLEFISEDKWKVSYLDKKLKIFNGENKNTWKIQLGKTNIINIKKKIASIGKSHEFSYQSKVDYNVALQKKR